MVLALNTRCVMGTTKHLGPAISADTSAQLWEPSKNVDELKIMRQESWLAQWGVVQRAIWPNYAKTAANSSVARQEPRVYTVSKRTEVSWHRSYDDSLDLSYFRMVKDDCHESLLVFQFCLFSFLFVVILMMWCLWRLFRSLWAFIFNALHVF